MEIHDLTKEFVFLDKQKGNDIYFCNCGESFEVKVDELESEIASENTVNKPSSVLTQDDLEYLGLDNAIKEISLAGGEKIICPDCKKNIAALSNQKKTFLTNQYFIGQFNFKKTDTEITVIFEKIKVIAENNKLKKETINKYLRFNKLNKKFFFKNFNDSEIEVDLQDSIKYSNEMFSTDISTIYEMHQLHSYIGEIAKHVSDVNNTDIVSTLLNETRGNVPTMDMLNIVAKISSIFIGIIKYSSLSTIAMTKGVNFLYDLMIECNIPDSQTMIESNATSPLQIFNLLIKNYIAKVNDEVNEDNTDVHEYTFRSKKVIASDADSVTVVNLKKEQKLQIKYKKHNNYTTKVKDSKGGYEVDKLSEDASASKFILKRIKTFGEFKQILKFFKFYNRQEIIALLQKRDMSLLTSVIDLIYFRDKMELKELYRVLDIIESFASKKENNISEYSFTYYDDCIMMMEVLDFDPKREFNKIHNYNTLIEYHDNLVRYFNLVSDSEKSEKFLEFVDRFRYIEKKESNSLIEIKLIDSPAMLIQEGVKMRHSASSYSKKVINNIYLIGQVFYHRKGEDITRFTIGFNFDKLKGIEFHQVKGAENKQGSNAFKTDLMEYLKLKDISFRPLKDLKIK